MPENKFDLNKALQAAKLYNKIDYGNLYVPDVQQTMDNFENWRKSQGYKTEEEKKKQLEEEKKKALDKSSQIWSDLGNSEDVYEWYNAHESDPEKQEEFRRNGETTAGILSTVATLPFTAGMMGWVPAITTTATGAAGGYAGAYGGQKLGQYFDNKYGTNTTPWLSTVGGLAGGILGGGLGYKGWEGATNQYLINKAFKSGQLKYGRPTAYTAYHQSSTPITKFKFPFKERWDVRTHGADPNGAFFTAGEPASAGFLAERPYTGQFHVKVQKPLIQTGELTGPTKNSLRNAIVRRARRDGADAVFFDGIADNQLQNQQILFAMDNADIGYRGMVSTPFKRQLFWNNPKGMRNWDTQMGIARNTGDLEKMQQIRDAHFLQKSGTVAINEDGTVQLFAHTTPNKFTVFDKTTFGRTDEGYHGKGFYFSPTRIVEDDYTIKLLSSKGKLGPRNTRPLANYGKNWMYGYLQGTKFKPARWFIDTFDNTENIIFTVSDDPLKSSEFIIGNSSQFKLAAPETFDDAGHFIKLSKRDNVNNPDIRYKKGGKIENPDH